MMREKRAWERVKWMIETDYEQFICLAVRSMVRLGDISPRTGERMLDRVRELQRQRGRVVCPKDPDGGGGAAIWRLYSKARIRWVDERIKELS